MRDKGSPGAVRALEVLGSTLADVEVLGERGLCR
jgi:hypothetical protein